MRKGLGNLWVWVQVLEPVAVHRRAMVRVQGYVQTEELVSDAGYVVVWVPVVGPDHGHCGAGCVVVWVPVRGPGCHGQCLLSRAGMRTGSHAVHERYWTVAGLGSGGIHGIHTAGGIGVRRARVRDLEQCYKFQPLGAPHTPFPPNRGQII
jgi:hypothetical protein